MLNDLYLASRSKSFWKSRGPFWVHVRSNAVSPFVFWKNYGGFSHNYQIQAQYYKSGTRIVQIDVASHQALPSTIIYQGNHLPPCKERGPKKNRLFYLTVSQRFKLLKAKHICSKFRPKIRVFFWVSPHFSRGQWPFQIPIYWRYLPPLQPPHPNSTCIPSH